MTVSKLIRNAVNEGVFLDVKGDDLTFKLSVDVFPEDLKQKIIENKKEIVDFIKKSKVLPEKENIPKIDRYERKGEVILPSFSQQRLWMIDHLEGSSCEYNIPMSLRVKGHFDISSARLAIERIIKRHESLRTNFAIVDDVPVQVIKNDFQFELQAHDLKEYSQTEQERRIRELINSDRTKIFNLSSDLLVRASYIILSPESGILLFNVHHIAFDAWSTSILANEFIEQYEFARAGKPDLAAPLKIQYADYAQWQRDWLQGSVLEKQLNFWKSQLENIPEVHGLPLDYTRPNVKSRKGARVVSLIPREVSRKLNRIALKYDVTLFMLLQAALAILFSKYSRSSDVVLGTLVANRMHYELEPLIGFFVNTLVLRTKTSFSRFDELLNSVKNTNIDVQSNQDIPFEYLVEHCKVSRSANY